jgi:hypothetical protein
MLAEADAMLQGSYLRFLIQEQRPIPKWAWLNPLAHAPVAKLHHLAEAVVNRAPTDWGTAVCLLAGNLLNLGSSAEGVCRLQRDVLVPLELDWLSGRARTPSSPGDLMAIVGSALNEHGSYHDS